MLEFVASLKEGCFQNYILWFPWLNQVLVVLQHEKRTTPLLNNPPSVGVCPLVFAQKRPFFPQVAGELGEQIQELAQRGNEANASQGTQPEAPGRTLGLGHQQHAKPENRDSQHMLNQHRGSFPDSGT